MERINSASMGLSSKCRMRNSLFITLCLQLRSLSRQRLALGWRLIEHRPEGAGEFDCVRELLKIDRLDDVGVDAQFVAFSQIRFFPGRGKHDYRDLFEFGIGLYRVEHFQ